MADQNVVALTGRLTRDPELRSTSGGKSVASFSLAVNGWKKDDVTYVDCEAWERTAEVLAEYTQRGSQVAVQGRLKLDQWETKDGQKRSKLKVTVNELTLLGDKGEQAPPKPSQPNAGDSQDDDEIPF